MESWKCFLDVCKMPTLTSNRNIVISYIYIYTSIKVKSHPVFVSNSPFFKDVRSWTRNALMVIYHYRLDHRLQSESYLNLNNYEIKLVDMQMDILKLQKSFIWLLFFNNLRKRTSESFSRTFEWIYGEALFVLIYSVASITTTFTPKLPHSSIHSTNYATKALLWKSLPFFQNCVCEFSNILPLWITLVHIMANKVQKMLKWIHIRGHGKPLKCVNRLLLPEFSC